MNLYGQSGQPSGQPPPSPPPGVPPQNHNDEHDHAGEMPASPRRRRNAVSNPSSQQPSNSRPSNHEMILHNLHSTASQQQPSVNITADVQVLRASLRALHLLQQRVETETAGTVAPPSLRALVPGYSPPPLTAPPFAEDDVRVARFIGSRTLSVNVLTTTQGTMELQVELSRLEYAALVVLRTYFSSRGRLNRSTTPHTSNTTAPRQQQPPPRLPSGPANNPQGSTSASSASPPWSQLYGAVGGRNVTELARAAVARQPHRRTSGTAAPVTPENQIRPQNNTDFHAQWNARLRDLQSSQLGARDRAQQAAFLLRDLRSHERETHTQNASSGSNSSQASQSLPSASFPLRDVRNSSSGPSQVVSSNPPPAPQTGFWWQRRNATSASNENSAPHQPRRPNPFVLSDYTPPYNPEYVVQSHLDIVPDPPSFFMNHGPMGTAYRPDVDDSADRPPSNNRPAITAREADRAYRRAIHRRFGAALDDAGDETDEDMPDLVPPTRLPDGDYVEDDDGNVWDTSFEDSEGEEGEDGEPEYQQIRVRRPQNVRGSRVVEYHSDAEVERSVNFIRAYSIQQAEAPTVVETRLAEANNRGARDGHGNLQSPRPSPSPRAPFDPRRVAMPPLETLRRLYASRSRATQTTNVSPRAAGNPMPTPQAENLPSSATEGGLFTTPAQAPLASDGTLLANMERRARGNIPARPRDSSQPAGPNSAGNITSTYDIPTGASSDVGTSAFFDTTSGGNSVVRTSATGSSIASEQSEQAPIVPSGASGPNSHVIQAYGIDSRDDEVEVEEDARSDGSQNLALASRSQGYPFPVVQGPQNLSQNQRSVQPERAHDEACRPTGVGDLLGVTLPPPMMDPTNEGDVAGNVTVYDQQGRRSDGFSIISGYTEEAANLTSSGTAGENPRSIGGSTSHRMLAAGPPRGNADSMQQHMEVDGDPHPDPQPPINAGTTGNINAPSTGLPTAPSTSSTTGRRGQHAANAGAGSPLTATLITSAVSQVAPSLGRAPSVPGPRRNPSRRRERRPGGAPRELSGSPRRSERLRHLPETGDNSPQHPLRRSGR